MMAMSLAMMTALQSDLPIGESLFIKTNKEIWLLILSGMGGLLYNKYHDRQYNSNTLENDIKKLLMDDDVQNKAGIIPYLLSDMTIHDEKHLNIRAFSDSQKTRAYQKQDGICLCCGRHFEFEEMQGDHIIPWSQGGRTVDENLQMLCQKCNNDKRDK